MMECQLFNRFSIAALVIAMATICLGNTSLAQENTLAPGMTSAQGEEVVGRTSGFSAVVTLDDTKLDSLLRNGLIEVNVPVQLKHSIDSVILKRPIYFKEKKAVGFADAELAGRSLEVKVDDEIIDRIDYQPIELKVYETGYSSVILRYIGLAGNRNRGLSNIGDPKTDSPVLTVKLKSGKGIAGRISGMQSLDINSTIGQIRVSFAKTNKILVGEKGELNIEMINGDLISGTINGGKIELLNRWENETIDLATVAALVVQRPKTNSVGRAAQVRQLPFQH